MSPTTQRLYERTLVLRSQIGDEAAFRELLELHGPHLLRFARKMIESPQTAEDLAREIWVAIFRGPPGLRDVDKFRPWAFRIARDRIHREYRRRKINLQPPGDDEHQRIPAPAGCDADCGRGRAGVIGNVTTGPMTQLPLVLVPAFIVPFLVMLYCIALFQARQSARLAKPAPAIP